MQPVSSASVSEEAARAQGRDRSFLGARPGRGKAQGSTNTECGPRTGGASCRRHHTRRLGLAEADRKKLDGRIKHLYHLAAIYDLKAGEAEQEAANVQGTRHVIAFANDIKAGCVHHVSSIAAAGLYEGMFREDMFEEAADYLDHPYFRTKHDAERIVRSECRRPWRVYRPGIVVGDSTTGEMDMIDGPYYFFKLIQKMRRALPPWMPAIGIEGGRINIVPVDFVPAPSRPFPTRGA